MFWKKGVLRNYAKFTGLSAWHRYFPVNFAKFLRTPSEATASDFCLHGTSLFLLESLNLYFVSLRIFHE